MRVDVMNSRHCNAPAYILILRISLVRYRTVHYFMCLCACCSLHNSTSGIMNTWSWTQPSHLANHQKSSILTSQKTENVVLQTGTVPSDSSWDFCTVPSDRLWGLLHVQYHLIVHGTYVQYHLIDYGACYIYSTI